MFASAARGAGATRLGRIEGGRAGEGGSWQRAHPRDFPEHGGHVARARTRRGCAGVLPVARASASGINGSCALGVVGWSCHRRRRGHPDDDDDLCSRGGHLAGKFCLVPRHPSPRRADGALPRRARWVGRSPPGVHVRPRARGRRLARPGAHVRVPGLRGRRASFPRGCAFRHRRRPIAGFIVGGVRRVDRARPRRGGDGQGGDVRARAPRGHERQSRRVPVRRRGGQAPRRARERAGGGPRGALRPLLPAGRRRPPARVSRRRPRRGGAHGPRRAQRQLRGARARARRRVAPPRARGERRVRRRHARLRRRRREQARHRRPGGGDSSRRRGPSPSPRVRRSKPPPRRRRRVRERPRRRVDRERGGEDADKGRDEGRA